MSLLRQIAGTFFSENVTRTLRTSLLSTAVMLLLSSTGTWKYMASTIDAYEMTRAVAWSGTAEIDKLPLVIAIDDTGYEKFFNAKSPVDRENIQALLATIAAHTGPQTRVTIDIDLSPVPGQATQQAALEKFLLQSAGKWVLPAVRGGNPQLAASLASWRTGLCARGIDFGLPYIPNEFGYPKMSHQYANSLGDASSRHGTCADPEQVMVQKALPLQPTYLKSGLVLPFSGDLALLGSLLDSINPPFVVLGGSWGQTDIFATPFGDRYGVQIHAAALAGTIQHEHLAPVWVEVLSSWAFMSTMSILMFYLLQGLVRCTETHANWLPGHTFFTLRLRPILVIVVVCGMLYLLMESLAMLHAATGFWMNTAKIAGYTIVCLLVPWNLGRVEPAHFKTWESVARGHVTATLRKEMRSIRHSVQIVLGRSTLWFDGDKTILLSRPRALFEGSCALISLSMQSVLPVVSLGYILYKSLPH
jgi:CHASE2 domain-containing sensor protein